MLRSRLLLAAGFMLTSLACGDSAGDTTGPGGSSSHGGAGGDTGSGAGGSGGDGFGGQGFGGAGGGAGQGCTKVDFLFVIDNSVSMNDEQDALVASFPGFIDTIQKSVASDYHIMVADTDDWGRCNTANPWTGLTPTSPTCNDYIKTTVFEECDRVRGAGVIHPAGEFASNMRCNVSGGKRYITQAEPDPGASFACMAKVGTAGHPSERPMEGIVTALSPELSAPEACNAGFLRSDAILVITFISDDPAYEDTGTPQSWYDAVVAAKGGKADSVVVLGLTPYEGAMAGAHWHEFIGLWGDKGLEAPVSNPDYTPFFGEAVAIVEEACEQFVPE